MKDTRSDTPAGQCFVNYGQLAVPFLRRTLDETSLLEKVKRKRIAGLLARLTGKPSTSFLE